jgi:hypothetical protein
VVSSGSPPAYLSQVLLSRIRARETEFEWLRPAQAAPAGQSTQPSAASPDLVHPALAELLAITVLGWTLRRRVPRLPARSRIRI